MASAKDTAAGDGLIVPAKIPGDDLSPENIRAAAASLTGNASAIRAATASVDTSWGALPASFVAPDAQVVYAAMTPASESARTFAGKLDRIAHALNAFADELGPVKSTLKGIKQDAIDFLKDFDSHHRVWVDASGTKKYEFDPKASAYGPHGTAAGNDPVSYLRSRGETARMHDGVPQIKASWLESSWHVDRNNQLLDRVADAYAKVNGFEVECGNKIDKERDDCVAPLTAVEAWQLKQSGDNTVDLPWGHRVEEDRNCGESVWHGFGSAGLQTLQGLGGLVLGYDPARNEFWRGDAWGKAWTGTITGLGSLLLAANPATWVLGGLGVPVFRDAVNNDINMFKGLVSWDEWSKNPGEAFGATAFNVLTFLIPGAGEVGGAIKAITMGTKLEIVANALTKVEEVTSKVTKILPEHLGTLFDEGGALDRATLPKEIDLPKTEPHVDVPGGTHVSDGHAPAGMGHPTSHDGGHRVAEPAPPTAQHEIGNPNPHTAGPEHSANGQDGGASTSTEHPQDSGVSPSRISPWVDHPSPADHPRPTPQHQVTVSGADLPGSKTAFADRTGLEPNTVYHVDGRGDFYTNAEGRVDYVETTYGGTGNLNYDLMEPHPDTTYVVHPAVIDPVDGASHAHVFHIDSQGRTDYAHTDHLSLGDADRSPSVQARVGGEGGDGYDGGHLFGKSFGGGGEYSNLTAMLRDLNRGSGDTFYNLENRWRKILEDNPSAQINVDIRPRYTGDGKSPYRFDVIFRVDGELPFRKRFPNV